MTTASVGVAAMLLTAAPALAQNAAPSAAGAVTAERLLNTEKEPQNWLTHHGNYAGHRYSSLDEINRENVRIRLYRAHNVRGNKYAPRVQPGTGFHDEVADMPMRIVKDEVLYLTESTVTRSERAAFDLFQISEHDGFPFVSDPFELNLHASAAIANAMN